MSADERAVSLQGVPQRARRLVAQGDGNGILAGLAQTEALVHQPLAAVRVDVRMRVGHERVDNHRLQVTAYHWEGSTAVEGSGSV